MRLSRYRQVRNRYSSKQSLFFKKRSTETNSYTDTQSKETFFQPSIINAQSTLHRKCDDCTKEDKKIQRVTDKKEKEKPKEEKLQKKEASASNNTTNKTSAYISSLNGKGQSLSKQQQYFFGGRMNYDFSNVKIHTDKEAAASAKEINAKAYTIGNDIVFNEGQYNAESTEGKKLMAHELTHVMQQNSGQVNRILQRTINYPAPTITKKDPIPLVLSGTHSTLGKTYLTINGIVANTKLQAMQILFEAFNKNLTLNYDGVSKTCRVNVQNINIDISQKVEILNDPAGGKWTGSYAGSLVNGCGNKSSVQIDMDSQPSGAAAFSARVAADEQEHVNDFNTIAQRHVNRFYTYLSSIALASKDGSDCATLFNTEMGHKDMDMVTAFADDIIASINTHDSATGNHHHSSTTTPGNCNVVRITVNF